MCVAADQHRKPARGPEFRVQPVRARGRTEETSPESLVCFTMHCVVQEGELRPQLLDRFGMSVQVRTLLDVGQRTQLVLDRMAFEADPEAFLESVRPEQEALTAKLVAARQRLPK